MATRTGRITQEPLYPEGHPKRIEQDSQRNNIDVPSSSKRKKKKNEIRDIFYNGLTDASRDHLDSCVGCVFRERTVEQAELLLNNILSNDNDWTLPELTPTPTPKKRGILFLSPEDM